ncbi:MAG: alkylation response protein AidB-like acyl-CoA dehydrogenase [Hyphomicrobiaceae bacterium]|jgi:alkylation response protein AidB-like acyl-CoA dehydrogenase
MERPEFTEEQKMFRETAREFFKREIRPHREEWRQAGIVDRDAYLKAGQAGLLCMWADEKYGGMSLPDFRFEQILMEENAAHGDVNFFATLHSRLVAPYIENFGTEEQKARFIPGFVSGESILAIAMTEPDAGSDLSGMRATAVRDGDDWLLNGQKTYISNGILSDVIIVAAKTDPESPYAMGLFLIERGMPGFERGRNLKKMGMKGQDTAELFFENVRVPAANVLGAPDQGFLQLMQGLAEERLIASVGNVSGCHEAMKVTKEFVTERKVFGKPLSKFQNTRFKLASLDADIDVAQCYVDRAVQVHNQGRLTAEDAARIKLVSSELAGRVVDECLQLHGGAGYMDEYEICHMYKDERINRILAGSSEIMKEIIARQVLGR